MLAAQIFRETVDDIFSDLDGSLQCLAPTLVGLALIVVVGFLTIGVGSGSDIGLDVMPTPGQVVAFLILFLVLCVGWLWTAVAWHRMIVLGEKPGRVFPSWHGGKIFGYLGRGLLVVLLVLLASLPLAIIASLIAPNTVDPEVGGDPTSYTYMIGSSPTDLSPLGIGVWFVMTAIVYGLSLRLSLILPAGAVGRPLSLGEAWSLTTGRFVGLFAPLGILLALVVLAINLIAGLVSFGGVLDLFALSLETLLGIGVLTRLYIYFTDRGQALVDNPLPQAERADMPPE